jgi:hypothetical protein
MPHAFRYVKAIIAELISKLKWHEVPATVSQKQRRFIADAPSIVPDYM